MKSEGWQQYYRTIVKVKIDFYKGSEIDMHLPDQVKQLPFVYLESYRNWLAERYNAECVLAVERSANVYVLMSTIRSKLIVNAQILSVPFSGNNPSNSSDQKKFFEGLLREMKAQKIADRIVTPQNYIVFDAVPEGSKYCRFGSYQVDLHPATEQLYSNVHPKHRNKINKAERAGVEVRSGVKELEVFYHLYVQTMNRSSMFCESFDFFKSYFHSLGDDNCICAVAYHNGEPQGAILAPFTNFCCYYIYGASADRITESGAINFLHWKVMLMMKDRGIKAYDFVGARLSDVSNTKLEGIQSFKERFGGELKKGFLFKADINTTKCAVYDSLVKIKNRVKGVPSFKDIIDQENAKQEA
jgi:hypothetical protein